MSGYPTDIGIWSSDIKPLYDLGYCASLEFYTFLRSFRKSFAENRRDCHFSSEMIKKYCGDLRRQRIYTKYVQKDIKVLAREIP